MKLEHLLTYRAELKPAVSIGQGPHGLRLVYDVTGGTFEGPRLRGTLLPSGGDWVQFGADGIGRLDVRATFVTDDGAHIYLQYTGIGDFAAGMEKFASGGSTDFGEIYFITSPRFETGDERYVWLNRIVAVAEGRAGPGWVEYNVSQVVSG